MLALYLVVSQPTAAVEPPTTGPAEPTLADEVVEAQRVVAAELGEMLDGIDAPETAPVTLVLRDGFLVAEVMEQSPRFVKLPGGTARLTRRPARMADSFGSFELLLPTAAPDASAVLAGEAVVRYTRLHVGPDAPDTLHLSSDAEWPGAAISVEVIQISPILLADADQPARFMINGTLADGTILRERHAAVDFVTLRREHRALFDEWATPLFKSLGVDAVLQDELAETAIDVLLEHLPIDAMTKAAVDEAVVLLDAADWADRKKAGDRLRSLGPAAAGEVARLLPVADDLSPEAEQAMLTIVADLRVVDAAEAQRLRNDPQFLRDVAALDGDDEVRTLLREAATSLLEE